jgi:hypothetical protein
MNAFSRYLTILTSLVLAMPIALGQDVAKAGKGEKKPPTVPNYFPLEAGNKWTHRLEADGKSVAVTTTVRKIDTINGVMLARLEALLNDDVVARSIFDRALAAFSGIFTMARKSSRPFAFSNTQSRPKPNGEER